VKRASRNKAPRPTPVPKDQGSQTKPAPKRDSRLLAAVLIGVLAFAVYIPGFRNGFVYDAEVAVQQDTRIQSLDNAGKLLVEPYWSFDKERLALYRPVVTLSYAIDWTLYDGAPAGFHFTNALAHALVSALVFLVLIGMVSVPAAFAGAALFAVHPVQTEAVASIVGRADIFAAGFCFAALLAWRRLPPRAAASLIALSLLFLLALGSKESAIMLPVLLVLFDLATGKLSRIRFREWLRDRFPIMAAMTLVAIGYIALRGAVLGVFTPQSLNPIMSVYSSEGTRIRTALQIWPEILRLLTLPWRLLVDYSPRVLVPAESWTPRAIAGLLLLLATIVGGIIALMKKRSWLGLALLWVPIAMFPVSNLVVPIGVLLAERTLYIAVFAIALGVAAIIDRIAGANNTRLRAALAVCAMVCVLFSARTISRLPAWSTTAVVFETLIRDRPDSFRGQWQAGFVAARNGDIASAMKYYVAAIVLWPYSHPLYIEAGAIASEAQQHAAARWFSEQGLMQFPDDILFLRRLAVASISLNDTAAARAAIARGLKVRPDDELFNMMRDSIGVAPQR
jgi:hypothetical protein